MYRIKIIKGNPYIYRQISVRLKGGRVKTKTIQYMGRATPELQEKLGITRLQEDIRKIQQAQGKRLSSKRKKRKVRSNKAKRRS